MDSRNYTSTTKKSKIIKRTTNVKNIYNKSRIFPALRLKIVTITTHCLISLSVRPFAVKSRPIDARFREKTEFW